MQMPDGGKAKGADSVKIKVEVTLRCRIKDVKESSGQNPEQRGEECGDRWVRRCEGEKRWS
jgi:hypothetical protein